MTVWLLLFITLLLFGVETGARSGNILSPSWGGELKGRWPSGSQCPSSWQHESIKGILSFTWTGRGMLGLSRGVAALRRTRWGCVPRHSTSTHDPPSVHMGPSTTRRDLQPWANPGAQLLSKHGKLNSLHRMKLAGGRCLQLAVNTNSKRINS